MVVGSHFSDRRAALLVALVAVMVALPGIGNGFAYDDFHVIVDNPELHHPSTMLTRAFSPYINGEMLRPVPLLGFAVQWLLGGGTSLIFRLFSLGLYALTSLLVYLVCRHSGAGINPAFVAGLVFAVHPVHSEVTANAVGQSELLNAVAILCAMLVYLNARRNLQWSSLDISSLAFFYVMAMHTKESGYVFPALLVAAEITRIDGPHTPHERMVAIRRPMLLLTLLLVGSLALRNLILGSMGGGLAHVSLADFTHAERVIAVLTLIPEWARLLLWPARLQAEYGPPALNPAQSFGVVHLGGIALLTLGFVLARAWRRGAAFASFGMAWIAITVLPVSNLLFPTGVLVAERTLFLPSIGLAFVVAGVGSAFTPALTRARWVNFLVAAAILMVLFVGGWRSAVRQAVWHDTLSVLEQGVAEAPTTYRAHLVLGRYLQGLGDQAGAEVRFRIAIDLWDQDPRPFEELGQLLRVRGACSEAIPILSRGMRAGPGSDVARSRLIECLIVERRWDAAEREAEAGLAQGVAAYQDALGRIRAGRLEASQP